MSISTRNSNAGRFSRGLLVAAVAVAASLAAFAPAANANDLEFEPGSVYAKAHDPITTQPALPFPWPCEPFQCAFFAGTQNAWWQEIIDAPELTQAAAHPDFSTSFRFTNLGPNQTVTDHVRDVIADAPAGAVGNPLAVTRCEAVDFHLALFGSCPKESQVGTATSSSAFFGGIHFLSPVSSMVPYPGAPALLGFKSFAYTALLVPEVRTAGDYGLRVSAKDLPIPIAKIIGSTVTLWGVPHDPINDRHRVDDVGGFNTADSDVPGTPVPFLSAPTNCSTGPIGLTVSARAWEQPQRWIEETSIAPEPTDCDQIEFDPAVSAEPTTNVAEQPTGLEVDVHTPQNNECEAIVPAPPADEPQFDCGLATSHLKDTTVTLPEGLQINPSGANGLDSCSPGEVGLTTPVGTTPVQFNGESANCPDASAVAEVEVETPLLDAPMPGRVYIADPHNNPFNSLLALYIVADFPERGIIVKLAGEVTPDPDTGQITSTFANAPQLPFEHFRLSFKEGPHAQLTTPAVCGEYSVDSQLTPYAAPGTQVSMSSQWAISQGPGGLCANAASSLPHAPSFDAGAVEPIAGAYSPFVVRLRRDDATQQFSEVTLKPPAGLTAKLAGTPYCSEAALNEAEDRPGADEQSDPSCPSASEVGDVHVAAGSGPDPYNASGKAYLAGPFGGAPLSLAIITPAVAGPFDLGTVVTRVALRVNPVTAEITAESEAIPEILAGIPLNVKAVDVVLDKPEFAKNPTSCDPTTVDGSVLSTSGESADVSERFQLAECRRLGFQPKLYLRLFGRNFNRSSNPRLRAVLVPREGDANIARTVVRMPNSIFLDQDHIRTVCTRAQFATETCPEGSIYGRAAATTPLLDAPLRGNVYLRSSDNPLPDLVSDLEGQVSIEAIGRTDSVKGALRNTFDIVPDAPVGKFVLLLQPGQKSLLVASRNLCAGVQRAFIGMNAHNGRVSRVRQRINIPRCRQIRQRAKRRAQGSRGARRASLSAAQRTG